MGPPNAGEDAEAMKCLLTALEAEALAVEARHGGALTVRVGARSVAADQPGNMTKKMRPGPNLIGRAAAVGTALQGSAEGGHDGGDKKCRGTVGSSWLAEAALDVVHGARRRLLGLTSGSLAPGIALAFAGPGPQLRVSTVAHVRELAATCGLCPCHGCGDSPLQPRSLPPCPICSVSST